MRTVRKIVLLPDELKLVEYDELLPEPPSLSLHEWLVGVPPLRIAVHLTHWLMVGDNGKQLTLSIRGGSGTSTVLDPLSLPTDGGVITCTVVVPSSLPATLLTLSETR